METIRRNKKKVAGAFIVGVFITLGYFCFRSWRRYFDNKYWENKF